MATPVLVDPSFVPLLMDRAVQLVANCLEDTSVNGRPEFVGLYHASPPADCCFAAETEVVTGDGVFPIGDLVGREVEVMTAGGGWVKAPVKSFGIQRLNAVHLSRRGEKKVVFATSEHRWFVDETLAPSQPRYRGRSLREERTSTLRPGDKLAVEAGEKWTSYDRDAVLAGIVYGDGSATPWSCRVTLYGVKASLAPLFAGERATGGDRRYPESVGFSGMPTSWKQTPDPGGDRSWLMGWLMGYVATDGSVGRDGRARLSSADRFSLETVRAICYRLGIVTSKINSQMRLGFGKELSPVFSVSLLPSSLPPGFFVRHDQAERFAKAGSRGQERWTVESVVITNRVEEVFCAVVTGSRSFVLADNILTGNCDSLLIWLERIVAVKDFPGTYGGALRCDEVTPSVHLAMSLYRPCWPVVKDNAQNPFAGLSAEADLAAVDLAIDATTMFCCLLTDLSAAATEANPDSIITAGECLPARMGEMTPIGPRGGCAGWTVRFQVGLPSCCSMLNA